MLYPNFFEFLIGELNYGHEDYINDKTFIAVLLSMKRKTDESINDTIDSKIKMIENYLSGNENVNKKFLGFIDMLSDIPGRVHKVKLKTGSVEEDKKTKTNSKNDNKNLLI